MMGYTHEAIGAGGAVAASIVLSSGKLTPGNFIVAAVSGIIGGIMVDADVVDQKVPNKVTDGSRSRLAAIGILIVGLVLDYVFHLGIREDIILHKNEAIGGAVAFIVLGVMAHIIGLTIGHRTFSHSLWFVALTTISVYFIYPSASVYFFIGAILHLLFDLLNYQAPNKNGSWHGVWLLYPIKRGDGIALRKCKAAGTGNKTIYFIATITTVALTGYYALSMHNSITVIAPIILIIASVIILHFVRVKSEKEIAEKD